MLACENDSLLTPQFVVLQTGITIYIIFTLIFE
jgi:hypothetical protein